MDEEVTIQVLSTGSLDVMQVSFPNFVPLWYYFTIMLSDTMKYIAQAENKACWLYHNSLIGSIIPAHKMMIFHPQEASPLIHNFITSSGAQPPLDRHIHIPEYVYQSQG